jgi:hypothetical protein
MAKGIASTLDPIDAAQRRLVAAARLIEQANREMRSIIHELGGIRDPLAQWIREGTEATLLDASLEEAPRLLLGDALPVDVVRAEMKRARREASGKPPSKAARAFLVA